jgi:elongation factor 2
MEEKQEAVMKIVTRLNLTLTSEEQTMRKKVLMRIVMMRWLSAAEALLEMVVVHLPSPITA